MKQISTPSNNTESNTTDDKEQQRRGTSVEGAFVVPSERCIRNIMAYSRSYDVIKSELIGNIGLFKN